MNLFTKLRLHIDLVMGSRLKDERYTILSTIKLVNSQGTGILVIPFLSYR